MSVRSARNRRRTSVAILALERGLEELLKAVAGITYKIPRPRMTITVALAVLVILTVHSIGIGRIACAMSICLVLTRLMGMLTHIEPVRHDSHSTYGVGG